MASAPKESVAKGENSRQIEGSDNCIFCTIAGGNDKNTTILYEDANVVAFADRKPAAPHHYLIVPKIHIKDASTLTSAQVEMVEQLVDIGRHVLEQRGGDFARARYGFHWPPFCSIKHLHLHVISPSDSILFKYNIVGMYSPNMPWFRTAQDVIFRLKNSTISGPPS